jgi:hypothetical protein
MSLHAATAAQLPLGRQRGAAHRGGRQQELVLLGCGAAHISVLRSFVDHPLTDVRITVITPGFDAPCTSMLPAYCRGECTRAECHVNLVRARLIGLNSRPCPSSPSASPVGLARAVPAERQACVDRCGL